MLIHNTTYDKDTVMYSSVPKLFKVSYHEMEKKISVDQKPKRSTDLTLGNNDLELRQACVNLFPNYY
jgi:hypothetical protein